MHASLCARAGSHALSHAHKADPLMSSPDAPAPAPEGTTADVSSAPLDAAAVRTGPAEVISAAAFSECSTFLPFAPARFLFLRVLPFLVMCGCLACVLPTCRCSRLSGSMQTWIDSCQIAVSLSIFLFLLCIYFHVFRLFPPLPSLPEALAGQGPMRRLRILHCSVPRRRRMRCVRMTASNISSCDAGATLCTVFPFLRLPYRPVT